MEIKMMMMLVIMKENDGFHSCLRSISEASNGVRKVN